MVTGSHTFYNDDEDHRNCIVITLIMVENSKAWSGWHGDNQITCRPNTSIVNNEEQCYFQINILNSLCLIISHILYNPKIHHPKAQCSVTSMQYYSLHQIEGMSFHIKVHFMNVQINRGQGTVSLQIAMFMVWYIPMYTTFCLE